jgi:hypothetical protein
MTCDFATVASDSFVYRVARTPDPWAWPDWTQAESDGTFGNRWDDPQGTYRVLYASSSRFGALIETLARFRPDLAVIAGLEEIDGPDEPTTAGIVPREWYANRLIGVARLDGMYADIGSAASLAVVRSQLAARAIHFGLPDIDAPAVRLVAPRGFTQEVSRLVYECETGAGEPFAGIRYSSRLDDRSMNWAVFEPGGGAPEPVAPGTAARLTAGDADVQQALAVLGLRAG